MRRVVAVFAALAVTGISAFAADVGAGYAGVKPRVTRNEHGYVMEMVAEPFREGRVWEWNAFSISACPQKECYRLSGEIFFPSTDRPLDGGTLRLPGLSCGLVFTEAYQDGMDSSMYRVALVALDTAGKGCVSVPKEIAGFYRF
jgi:hypothetical protein